MGHGQHDRIEHFEAGFPGTWESPMPARPGGFGPEPRRFVLALHAQGQVTTERLVALLNGIGVEICKRQVVRLLTEPLDTFVAEDQAVPRAGLGHGVLGDGGPAQVTCSRSAAQGSKLAPASRPASMPKHRSARSNYAL